MVNKVDFDDYADNYNELLAENTQFFSDDEEYFSRYKVELVAAQSKGSFKRVLEYGCGIGRNIPALRSAFPEADVVGSDISEASLEVARKNNPDVEFFIEGDDCIEHELFDLIFVAGVFHHIPLDRRAEAAALLAQRLAVNGCLYVFEHNPYNPVTRHIVNTCIYDEDAILLKPKTLRELLNNAGLQVLEHAYCLFIPPRFKKLIAIEKYFEWLPLGGQYWLRSTRAK